MKLTDVLLVTQSHKDQGEVNFVTTLDEFIEDLCAEESPEIGNMLRGIVTAARPYQWDGFYAAEGNKTYEMRLCQSQEDLLAFLGGKFNDSVEKMEDRLPGTAGMYHAWDWHNSPELFSVRAVSIIKAHARELGPSGRKFAYDLLTTMPDFPTEKGAVTPRAPRLSDLIKHAEANRSLNMVSRRQLTRGASLEV